MRFSTTLEVGTLVIFRDVFGFQRTTGELPVEDGATVRIARRFVHGHYMAESETGRAFFLRPEEVEYTKGDE